MGWVSDGREVLRTQWDSLQSGTYEWVAYNEDGWAQGRMGIAPGTGDAQLRIGLMPHTLVTVHVVGNGADTMVRACGNDVPDSILARLTPRMLRESVTVRTLGGRVDAICVEASGRTQRMSLIDDMTIVIHK